MLFYHVCFGLELEMISNKTYGRIYVKISQLSNVGATVESNSNVFNTDKELSFARYKVQSNLAVLIKKISVIQNRMSKLDQTLSLSGSSLNKMYTGTSHDLFIKFNENVVYPSSPFYKKLKDLMAQVLLLPKKEVLLKVTLKENELTVQKNKKVESSLFDREKHCIGSAKSAVCKIKKLGFISL